MALDTKQISEELIKARSLRNRLPVDQDPYERFSAGVDPYQMTSEQIHTQSLRESMGDKTGPFEVPSWTESEKTTEDPTVQFQEYQNNQARENEQGWLTEKQETEKAFIPGPLPYVEGPIDTTVYEPWLFVEGPLPWLREPLQAPTLFPAMVPSWERR